MPTAAARLAVAALAVVCAVVAIRALHSDHRCADLKSGIGTMPVAELPGVPAKTIDRCGSPTDRATVALMLLGRKRPGEAAQLARRMTESSPQDYIGWSALARLTNDRRALARAHELNPRGIPAP